MGFAWFFLEMGYTVSPKEWVGRCENNRPSHQLWWCPIFKQLISHIIWFCPGKHRASLCIYNYIQLNLIPLQKNSWTLLHMEHQKEQIQHFRLLSPPSAHGYGRGNIVSSVRGLDELRRGNQCQWDLATTLFFPCFWGIPIPSAS